MKYEIRQQFISQNRSHKLLNAKGAVVHETADPGVTDEQEKDYFNTAYRAASAHFFVDWDSITQLIPLNEQSWHAGPSANKQFWGIELCRPTKHDPVQFQGVWNRGIWLFGWLFLYQANLRIVTKENLMSHAEVSAKWHETDHTDPVSYFSEYGVTVDDFRKGVQIEINNQVASMTVADALAFLKLRVS